MIIEVTKPIHAWTGTLYESSNPLFSLALMEGDVHEAKAQLVAKRHKRSGQVEKR